MHRLLPLAATTLAAAFALAGASAQRGSGGSGEAGPRPVSFLALGDSYTIGESVSEAERWPNQLAAALEKHGYGVDVAIVARTGWTTDELWAGIQMARLKPPYDMVSLLIGVNNQYRGWSQEQYRQDFRFLLTRAIEYAGGEPGRVLVLSIPDWGATPFAGGRDSTAIAREIDQFNAINRAESQAAGVHYVDITTESRADAIKAGYLAADGLHPSGKMYEAWMALALPAALQILSAEP